MTEIIVRSRQGGKTTELIRRAAEAGGYIVCTDQRRAWQIAEQARDMGLNIPFPLTVSEWQKHAYHPPGVRGLLFDDLDRIIQAMSAAPVLAATWTAEEAGVSGIGGYMPRKTRRYVPPAADDGIPRCTSCRARLDIITPWNQPHICKEVTFGTALPPLRLEPFQDEP